MQVHIELKISFMLYIHTSCLDKIGVGCEVMINLRYLVFFLFSVKTCCYISLEPSKPNSSDKGSEYVFIGKYEKKYIPNLSLFNTPCYLEHCIDSGLQFFFCIMTLHLFHCIQSK